MMRTRKILLSFCFQEQLFFLVLAKRKTREKRFISAEGQNLVTPEGEVFLMNGINLWELVKPEGYMFCFKM